MFSSLEREDVDPNRRAAVACDGIDVVVVAPAAVAIAVARDWLVLLLESI